MDYIIWVHVIESGDDAADKKFYNVLGKRSIPSNLISQISPWHQIHNQVQIVPVLERINHVN